MENLLPHNILQLSIAERIQLVQDIWDSITIDADDVNISHAQKQELERRLKLYDQNPHQVSTWEEVKQKFNS
ncbi:addiction module protein [Nodularia sp. NIES-3585]|uniref:addiction module protein n=1 Tax=Nodularia sp. NIES-3585 TaxID=1973477 RepID=UPI000B5C4BA3|nr:addiction module protein [Nodularia sp. NIES-3585]GAX34354.1 addiction module component [Nodularia sp. NIES-3585]